MRLVLALAWFFCVLLPWTLLAEEGSRAEVEVAVEAEDWARVVSLASELLKERDDEWSGEDLESLATALVNTRRSAEAEARLREQLVAKVDNWRVWQAAARILSNLPVKYGVMDEGRFVRGASGEDELWSGARDRAESVRWYLEAWQRGGVEADPPERLELLEGLSHVLLRQDYGWMTEGGPDAPLPEYGERVPRFSQFDEINKAILLPEAPWDAANDGELFRWALETAKALKLRPAAEYDAALGEALMDHYALPRGHAVDWWTPDPEFEDRLRNLSDLEVLDEGVVRRLVEENAFIPLLEPAAKSTRPADAAAERARRRISSFRRSRLQYERQARSIRAWLKFIPQERGDDLDPDDLEFGEGGMVEADTPRKRWIGELEALVGVHVEIPQLDRAFPLGRKPEMTLLVQNARDLVVTAQPINLERLLKRIESYLRSDPEDLEAGRFDLDYLQEMILVGGWRDLLGEFAFRNRYVVPANDWHRPMPRKIRLPLDEGGPWMVRYELPSGDVYFQLVWMADLAAVMHHGAGQSQLVVVDARDGSAVRRARVKVLGWREVGDGEGGRRLDVKKFGRISDERGRISFPGRGLPQDFSWMMWIESAGRLTVLPELSRFRPERMPSPAERLRLLLMPASREVLPGSVLEVGIFASGWGRDSGGQSRAGKLAGKTLRLRIEGQGQESAWQELTLDRFGSGRIRLKVPGEAGDYQIQLRSDDLPGIEKAGASAGVNRGAMEAAVISGSRRLRVREKEPANGMSLELEFPAESPYSAPFTLGAKIQSPEPVRSSGRLVVSLIATGLSAASDKGMVPSRRTLDSWSGDLSDGSGAVEVDLQAYATHWQALRLRVEAVGPQGMLARREVKLPRGVKAVPPVVLGLASGFVTTGKPFRVELRCLCQELPEGGVNGEVLLERRFQNGFELVDSHSFAWMGGVGKVDFTLADPGNYRLRSVVPGLEESESEVNFVAVDANGGGARIWSGEAAERDKLVKLVAEQAEVLSGARVPILVQSRWPVQEVMLFHGNSVTGYQLDRVTTRNHGAIWNLPVNEARRPDFTVVAFAVRSARLGRDEISLRVRAGVEPLNLSLQRMGRSIEIELRDPAGRPVDGRICLRLAKRLPRDVWEDPQRVFFGWENPKWWGLSHSLRSFGSRGFADILVGGGSAPRQRRPGLPVLETDTEDHLTGLEPIDRAAWTEFAFLEVSGKLQLPLGGDAADSGPIWVEANATAKGLQPVRWLGKLN